MTTLTRLTWVLLCAVAVLLLYLPATSGALYYDDYSNLQGLEQISSWSSAWQFVFGGHAGPLGRPLALSTFLPYSSGWPENAQAILIANVLLHCCNFVLLVMLGQLLIERISSVDCHLHFRIALGAAVLWAVIPLLASTSLIAVQRMTGLAAFFGLLGLIGFVRGYSLSEQRPLLGFLAQMAALGTGTLLSIFSKESGAVIPVFALIIDFFVRRNIYHEQAAKTAFLRRILLLLPLAFLIFYISPLHIDWFRFDEYRGFTPFERFMTEQVVLWEYLKSAFFPQSPTAFGPFHDYYAIKPVGLKTVLAALAWFTLLASAIVLRYRYKWFSLAVVWFLAGHLLESSSVLLELYFEHRNYLAVYGICLFFSVLAFTARGRLARVAPYFLAGYILLLSAVLLAMTVRWGQPEEAAESWNARHPGSARAALHAVFVGMNGEFSNGIEPNAVKPVRERQTFALRVLDRTKNACPDCLDVRLQALMYSCSLTPAEDTRARMHESLEVARFGRINVTVVDQLFNLQELLKVNACSPLNYSDLLSLIDRLRDSSKMNVQVYGAKIYFVRAIAAQELGDTEQVWASLDEAERIAPGALPVLQYQVYYALEQGDIYRAQQALARRESQPGVISQLPEQQLTALREAISAAMKENQQ
ncbi:hypothetical protein [Halopseudomonas aestusnigri]|uniref:hypothetical protein n=1 Tax=Halopseudomonas aestusnigri TaxID=857252 RepID=UPI0030C6B5DE